MSSHIPFTALCISDISTTTNGMYTQARIASSKCEDLRAKKRAQISHAQSTRNEAQRTYWTADVGHPKAGVTGGATIGDGVHGLRIGRRIRRIHTLRFPIRSLIFPNCSPNYKLQTRGPPRRNIYMSYVPISPSGLTSESRQGTENRHRRAGTPELYSDT